MDNNPYTEEKPQIKGYLQKLNWFGIKHLRYFMLYQSGMLKYLKDTSNENQGREVRYTYRITPSSTITRKVSGGR